ncbi:hypothetical protein OS175_03940 [Marinicella sp. S1101]|uniref:tetratricopeptide repeat protein n=1 Tax=Marinicella marina TaxID=2996016 RepID=UPI002260EF08|nr:hypothetical protein [Marinicella marina]MCX7553018.1 hypothetical protein [Marinicella marina]MDJ1139672.1 hypothetical protein [Marinicella marina]
MNFINELKRRNVFRVALAFLVVAWLLIQVAATLEDALNLPDWFDAMVVSILIITFPMVLVFSWAYEITPDGIRKESEIDKEQSITDVTAKRLDLLTLFAVLMLVVLMIWRPFQTSELQLNPQRSAVIPVNSSGIGSIDAALSQELLNTIAVLPFVNRSNNPDDLFFTDGMHDDILTQLTQIVGLKVISRTSVMSYRDSDKPLPVIAAELGAAVILEGGIQRAGNRIRVNAQLIDVKTDAHLWAKTYDLEMSVDHIFNIQSAITKQIVKAIKGQLSPQDERILDNQATNSLAAWEAYAKARAIMYDSGYNAKKYRMALEQAQSAVQADPQFLMAQLLVVNAHSSIYWIGDDVSEARVAQAKQELDKAIALDPTNPAVLAAQGEYFYRIFLDYKKALDYLFMAHQKRPNDAEILQSLALTQRRLGQWQKAIDNLLLADELNPGDQNNIYHAIETLFIVGDYEKASELMDDALNRFPTSSDLGALAVELPIAQSGDLQQARRVYQTIHPNTGDAYVASTINLAYLERDYKAVIATLHQPEVVEFYAMYPGMLHIERGQMHQFLDQEVQAMHEFNLALQALEPLDVSQDAFNLALNQSQLGLVKAFLGQHQEAIALAEAAMRTLTLEKDPIDGPLIHSTAVYVLALVGDRARALSEIERMLNTPSGFKYWYLKLDPHWDFIRDDTDFQALIESHRERPSKLNEA